MKHLAQTGFVIKFVFDLKQETYAESSLQKTFLNGCTIKKKTIHFTCIANVHLSQHLMKACAFCLKSGMK